MTILVAALAGIGCAQARPRTLRALALSTATRVLLGYAAGAIGAGLLSPSAAPHVPLLVLVLLVAGVMTASETADAESASSRRVLPPEALYNFLVSWRAAPSSASEPGIRRLFLTSSR